MRAFKGPIKVSCRGSKGRRINRDIKGESIGVSRDFFRGGDFSQIKTLHKYVNVYHFMELKVTFCSLHIPS